MRKFVKTTFIARTASICTWHGIALIFIAGILGSSVAVAQTGDKARWFQVELIAFKRQQQNTQEQWPTNIKLDYPRNWVELRDAASANEPASEADLPAPAAATPDTGFVLLPNAERKLTRYANALQRDSRFTVLFHQAWRQPIIGARSANAILINGGDHYGEHQELEGSVTLSLNQFLQIKTRLWLTQFAANRGQAPGDWPLLPPIPKPKEAPNLFISDVDQSLTQINLNEEGEESEEFLPTRIVVMEEDRRIRANELHYFDHPLFGLIVQLTPYEAQP